MSEQKIESVIGDYETFLDGVFSHFKKAGFAMSEFKELDHIAYRTETIERYEERKNELLEFSQAHSEKMRGERLILVCRLKNPLIYGEFSIPGFELLAPKIDNKFKEGLEHAEFVTKIPLSEFREKHSGIDFDLRAYGREDNPELVINFDRCAAKFHAQSLLEVRNI